MPSGTSAPRSVSRVPATWTIGAVVAFGLIGYMDDYIKVHHQRSLGLNKRAKSGAQLVCALVFANLAVDWAHTSTALSFTRSEAIGINMGLGRSG